MQKRKLEYALIFVVTLLLLVEVILANYKYSHLTKQKIKISNKISVQQEVINHRNYVITALNAIEIILDNNAYAQLNSFQKQLPVSLINYDYKISTSLLASYNDLHKTFRSYDFEQYNEKVLGNKNNILLQLTAVKTELESVLQDNYLENRVVAHTYQELNTDLDRIFKLILGLLILTVLSFYYFIKLISKDNKFKLKHIAQDNYAQDIINTVYNKRLEDRIVNIEYLCQKANYFNSAVKKNLSNQQKIIEQISQDYNLLNQLIDEQSTSNNAKLSFKLQAKAVDLTNKINTNLKILHQENDTANKQVQKNINNVNNIFYTNQKISKSESLALKVDD